METSEDERTEQPSYCLGIIIGIVAIIIYVIYNRVFNKYWERYGVKHSNILVTEFRSSIDKLVREHGDTVGINGGMLVTRDLSILKQVMVKDFNNFCDRHLTLHSNSALEKGLFFLRGQEWRSMRRIMSPSFATGKMKGMYSPIEDTARKLSSFMEECARNNQLFTVKHATGQYTSEIIARTAFGLQLDRSIGGDDDEFTYNAKNIFKVRGKFMHIFTVILLQLGVVPFLIKKLKISTFDLVNTTVDPYLKAVLDKSVAQRKQLEAEGKTTPRDFLQTLIARLVGNDGNEASKDIPPGNKEEKVPRKKTLTDKELLSQTMLVTFAAFETTSFTLQMCLYLLAAHPDVQDKVYEEIARVVSSASPTHEELRHLTYTQQVINETLRLYPSVPVIHRRALDTKTYGNITIPKGTGVLIPIFLVHLDPKNYADPQKFDPDRFTKKNVSHRDPMSFMPFGYGPRQCIGKRLALVELKFALVHVLRKVRLELNENTEPRRGEGVEIRSVGFTVVDKPIQLAVTLRTG